MKNYFFSFGFTILCLAIAGYWGNYTGMGVWSALWLTVVLGILEISLSFDNAVVNATVLKTMNQFWRKMFLTIGILIAVFGMRLVFPVVIVSVISGLGAGEVINMAMNNPDQYGQVLTDAYPMIAAFGGSFLLMVFLAFAFDEKRGVHWLGSFERKIASIGKLESIEIVVALIIVIIMSLGMPEELQFKVLLCGVTGIILFVVIRSIDNLFKPEDGNESAEADKHGVQNGATATVARNGFIGFLYLEVLDASFSFDGVIGAFAVTRDIVIIMLGLAIGAMFVRSITVDLVQRGTLDEFIYLEHGAMYAIGALALIMFIGTHIHVPEVLTGLIGAVFISISFWSSLVHRRKLS